MSYLTNDNKTANALIYEDSPYLLQHAYNPVKWLAWNDAAFAKAQAENKPIFLSIGYSSCHWCHVMESEVFENQELAEKLNELFVCIKVDREERPDLDKHYQLIHQIITRRSGGWPTSIFLTKNKKPFFAGTYIPPVAKYGMMAFGELIELLAKKHSNELEEIERIGINIENVAKASTKIRKSNIDFNATDKIKSFVESNFDNTHGGIAGEPKFPHTALLDFMLSSDDEYLRRQAIFTLKQMSKGGIYDLIDGGFCRYSVDLFWLVPHFEKMSYDNGPLIGLYAKAYSISGEKHFLKIAKECADFMIAKMSDDWLFYSASDADSKGEEGAYFVYDYKEALEALINSGFGDTIAKTTLNALGFSKIGNFEGKNIPVNENFENTQEIGLAINILKNIRESREYPFIDKKIICSWNAMMISGLFELSAVDNSYLPVAKKSLEKLSDKICIDEVVYHCTIDSKEPKIKAFLEDYAFLARAYLDGYKATKDEQMKKRALQLANIAKEKYFHDGVWNFSDGEFVTSADSADTSYTSPIAPICEVLLAFADYDSVSKTMESYADNIREHCAYHAGLAKISVNMQL